MYDDFDPFFEEFDKLRRRLLKEFFEDFEDIDFEKLEKDGWIVKRIEGPGTHGFVARRVLTNNMVEPRKRLIEVKDDDVLYDVFYQGDKVEIYVDLPGEREEDILVSAGDDWVEIETPTRKKKIYLKSKIDPNTISKKYVNGVLRLTLKKK